MHRRSVSALTPKQVEVVRVEQLEAKQGKNDLKRERATVHKVTVEQLNSVVKHYDAHVSRLSAVAVVVLDTEWYRQGAWLHSTHI